MAGSILKLSEVKQALQREKLNFKILNDTTDSVILMDELTKVKLRGKIVQSFNEGEVYHWPSLNHENINRLIDILCVRDDLYIYLTIDHDITLKNIVHDEDFIYEPRCFDRKRMYAKGIFSGLSYLHAKSLSLMNLCDDNIIISTADDRAIITNFDHLICERKSTRSRLNVPQMYMAPETEEGEFDSMKAEIWASGVLMLDMFLAHMIPWGAIDHKPKKVLKMVENLSLDLLQAANPGSVVSSVDLVRFKHFLKRFFSKNPRERIPLRYAYIASFLQYRVQHKAHKKSHRSVSFPEYDLSLDFCDLNLSTCYNPTYNPCFMQETQKREIETTEIASDASTIETFSDDRPVQFGEDKTKVDISNTWPLKNDIKEEEQENLTEITLMPSSKTVASIANAETIDDFQRNSKSSEEIKEDIKDENESKYNCSQSRSFTFITPKNGNDTIKLEKFSNENCCYLNNKASSAKQSVECDFPSKDLNLSYDNIYGDGYKNYPDIKDDALSVIEPGSEKIETGKKLTKIVKIQHLRTETQIKQRFPYEEGCNDPEQTFKNRIVKPSRTFKAPDIFLTPEIKSVINKIAFLRRCYISIQAHQKVFISNEFASRQTKFIKEYKNFLYLEDFRLREKLMVKHKLKFEDVKKLINYVNLGILSRRYQHETSVNRNFFNDTRGNYQQTQGMEDGAENNVRRLSLDKFKDTNSFIMRADRNRSYHKAIEYSENNQDQKRENIAKPDNEKLEMFWDLDRNCSNHKANEFSENNKDRKREKIATPDNGKLQTLCDPERNRFNHKVIEYSENNQDQKWKKITKPDNGKLQTIGEGLYFEPHSKMKPVFIPPATNNNKIIEEESIDDKKKEIVKECESIRKCVETVEEKDCKTGARPKKTQDKNSKNKVKREDKKTKVKVAKSPKMPDNSKIKEKKKMKPTNQKQVEEKVDIKSDCNKNLKRKLDKKEKNLRQLEKIKDPKRSWFSSLCPGGKVEEPTSIADTLCETCKLNLDFI